MQQTRSCGEISLIMLSHHQNNTFSLEQPCDAGEISPDRPPKKKKFVSTPWTNHAFQCGFFFSLFIYIFCGVGCLSQGKEGQREKLEVKREP